MLKIEYHAQFGKDFKLAIKRGCDVNEFRKVVTMLANQQPLPSKYKDHALAVSKKYRNVRKCHIQPDWLLIYSVNKKYLILQLIRTGTHSDLF